MPRAIHPDEPEFLRSYDRDRYRKPVVMVDIAIFTVFEQKLHVLLIKRGQHPFKDYWALPGGAVQIERDRSLEDAAMRELIEETGVKNQYLEQLGTYGGADRDPRDWSVSVAYFALVAAQNVLLRAGTDAAEARWQPVMGEQVAVELAFDHARILGDAVHRLRSKLDYTDLAVHLLPEEFTLSELQRVYEIIMQEKLNKSSFRQRLERASIVQPIVGKMRTGSNRPAQVYRFVERRSDRVFFPRSIAWAERDKADGG